MQQQAAASGSVQQRLDIEGGGLVNQRPVARPVITPRKSAALVPTAGNLQRITQLFFFKEKLRAVIIRCNLLHL